MVGCPWWMVAPSPVTIAEPSRDSHGGRGQGYEHLLEQIARIPRLGSLNLACALAHDAAGSKVPCCEAKVNLANIPRLYEQKLSPLLWMFSYWVFLKS